MFLEGNKLPIEMACGNLFKYSCEIISCPIWLSSCTSSLMLYVVICIAMIFQMSPDLSPTWKGPVRRIQPLSVIAYTSWSLLLDAGVGLYHWEGVMVKLLELTFVSHPPEARTVLGVLESSCHLISSKYDHVRKNYNLQDSETLPRLSNFPKMIVLSEKVWM